jgi:hypothetical protein
MSSDLEPSDRASEFRRALVATANLGPYVRRRPPLKLVVGSLAAFALAGALTGGAIATATVGTLKVDPAIIAARAAAEDDARAYARSMGGTLIGAPIARSASHTTVIDVGKRPAGATNLIEGFECYAPAKFVIRVDARKYARYDCTPIASDTGSLYTVTGNGRHVATVQVVQPGPFSVWFSWVKVPTYTSSSAQSAALADSVVTRDEDEAAFSRYQGCMNALGRSVKSTVNAVVPSMGFGDADGTSNRCYVTEWKAIDEQWQRQLRETDLGVKSIDACLATMGVTPDATPEARWNQLVQLALIQTRCGWIG